MQRLKALLIWFWHIASRPSTHLSLGFLALGGFICGVLFWAIGFAFMFEDGTPIIGTHGFFLQGLPETYGSTGVPLLAF